MKQIDELIQKIASRSYILSQWVTSWYDCFPDKGLAEEVIRRHEESMYPKDTKMFEVTIPGYPSLTVLAYTPKLALSGAMDIYEVDETPEATVKLIEEPKNNQSPDH